MVCDAAVSMSNKPLTLDQILESQRKDPVISQVLQYKVNNQRLLRQVLKTLLTDVKMLLRQWTKLYVN